MSETSSKNYNYDYDKIKDAREFAKKTNNEYLEALIDGFLVENDPEYRYDMYVAIVEGTKELKEIYKWN